MDKNQIVKPYLLTRKLFPDNQETPIHFLLESTIPARYFYRRNHFSYPVLSEESLLLSGFIRGSICSSNWRPGKKTLIFRYEDLLSMPAKTILAVIECSGNKRSYFQPQVHGEQWEDGAISQGRVTCTMSGCCSVISAAFFLF
ncbi:molybdopterin-dependent oxidoreductase [Aneurinibacillus terranovensis]|uniref:molybdopterin-dependent oxidoreductase n=1 Tax=Aneurinibacillus terranovensis TaxID=278991 RepID=UPI00041A1879|nr:molybdopterin-dependent oxidoreductase [Aneurinibacillus terranovensis]